VETSANDFKAYLENLHEVIVKYEEVPKDIIEIDEEAAYRLYHNEVTPYNAFKNWNVFTFKE
jgi:hypothetical protein